VARGEHDHETDVKELAGKALKLVEDFNSRTGRNIKVEIEPGTFLVANSGILVSEVMDIVSTRSNESKPNDDGYNFIKLNTGLNDITRPSLYGS